MGVPFSAEAEAICSIGSTHQHARHQRYSSCYCFDGDVLGRHTVIVSGASPQVEDQSARLSRWVWRGSILAVISALMKRWCDPHGTDRSNVWRAGASAGNLPQHCAEMLCGTECTELETDFAVQRFHLPITQ